MRYHAQRKRVIRTLTIKRVTATFVVEEKLRMGGRRGIPVKFRRRRSRREQMEISRDDEGEIFAIRRQLYRAGASRSSFVLRCDGRGEGAPSRRGMVKGKERQRQRRCRC